MKRALAAAALLLAACGSGGSNGSAESVASQGTATTQPAVEVDPAEAFGVELGIALDGDTPEFREQAAELARSMCDLLDSTVSGPAADDAANDSLESDAVMSASLTQAALGTVSGTGLEPSITAMVMRLGAEHFCPLHAGVVDDYVASLSG